MVGWHLLLLLVIELVAYGAVGRYMYVAHGWSVGQSVALAIAIYPGIRAVLVAAEFIIARSVGSKIPAPRQISWLRALAMYLREFAGWLLMFTLVMPYVLARRSVVDGEPGNGDPSTHGAPPVLLVHGLACNRGNWFWFKPRLQAHGYRVYTMDCTPPVSPIARYGDQVHAAVEEILAATGAPQVVLIGHSQGGLTIRAYLDRHGETKVAKVITLGSPHRGTFMARMAMGPNAVDMREVSEWLRGLSSREVDRAPLPYTRFTCLFTYHDNLVSPQENAVLPGAKAIALSGIGHLSLTLSPTVLRHVVSELKSAGDARL